MIVVTGATGNVGRVLVEALVSAGERVSAVSRGSVPVALPERVRQHRADLAEPESLRPAVDGARALFLMVPGAGAGLNAGDPSDVAEVAAAVLRESGHAGRAYELTGPELSTPRQRARVIGAALGQPVRFVEQTADQARAQMSRFMPGPVVEGTLAILGRPTEAEQRISPHVDRVLGRAPRTFADWVQRHIHAFG